MIPYYAAPNLHIGPFNVAVFSLLLISSVLLGLFLVLKRARGLGISEDLMFRLSFWALVCGLVGAHLAKLALDYNALFIADPLMVVKTSRGIRSLGAFLGGLLGAIGYCRLRRLSFLEMFRLLDIIAWTLPFAWMIGRLGCALAHDHRGLWTTSWIGVRFPEGTRYDLGLIEFLFLVALSMLFYWLDRKLRAPGFFFGLFGVTYGAFRIWLDTLHIQPFRFYGGAVGVALGLAGWTAMRWFSARATLRNAPARVSEFQSH